MDDVSARCWEEVEHLILHVNRIEGTAISLPEGLKKTPITSLRPLIEVCAPVRASLRKIAKLEVAIADPTRGLPPFSRSIYESAPYLPAGLLGAVWDVARAIRTKAWNHGRKLTSFPPQPTSVGNAEEAIARLDTLMAWCEEHAEPPNSDPAAGGVTLNEIELVMSKPTSKTINEHIRDTKRTDPAPPAIFTGQGKASIWKYADVLPWLRRQFPGYDWPKSFAEFKEILRAKDPPPARRRKHRRD
jgi:hypothetical protein